MRLRRTWRQDARGSGPFPLRVVVAASSMTAIANLPAFLIGALAHTMRAEIGFSAAGTGVAVSFFFGASAVSAPVLARFIQRAGPVVALRSGALGTAAALLAIAGWARSWPVLICLLVLAGVANAAGQTAANLTIAELAFPGHDGLAFGIKQASVPFASMLAGLAVPVFDSTLGWRWAFFLGATAAVGVAVFSPRFVLGKSRTRHRSARVDRRQPGTVDWVIVSLVTAGAFIAAGTALGLAVYLVEFALASGLEPKAAGVLLAVSSSLVVVVRVLMGWWMDARSRRGRPSIALLPVGLLVAAGAIGCLLLAVSGTSRVTLTLGAMLGLGCGWGWPGLMHLTIVQLNRDAAATATGTILFGVFGGGVVMPSLLGLCIEHMSYRFAWTAASGGLVIASGLLFVAHNVLRRRRRRT